MPLTETRIEVLKNDEPTRAAGSKRGRNAAIIAGTGTLFVVGLMILISRQFAKRVSVCARYAQSILAGNGEVKFEVKGKGEVARLYTYVKSLGEKLAAEKEELHLLAKRLVTVQEADRVSIARELHDEIGQRLTMCKMLVEKAARAPPQETGVALKEAERCLAEVMGKVRNISLDLQPKILDEGLLPALLWHFERYETSTNIHVNFDQKRLKRGFAPDTRLAAYRIIQEALNNAAKHAGVNEVNVSAWVSHNTLNLKISDGGAGFTLAAIPVGATGIQGMRDRALITGGNLTVVSAPGSGTTIIAKLPITEDYHRLKKGENNGQNNSS